MNQEITQEMVNAAFDMIIRYYWGMLTNNSNTFIAFAIIYVPVIIIIAAFYMHHTRKIRMQSNDTEKK